MYGDNEFDFLLSKRNAKSMDAIEKLWQYDIIDDKTYGKRMLEMAGLDESDLNVKMNPMKKQMLLFGKVNTSNNDGNSSGKTNIE